MKLIFKSFSFICILSLFVVLSCTKQDEVSLQKEEVSEEVLSKIANLGFSRKDVQKVEEGYLVEGDIILTDKDLSLNADRKTLRIAEVEQYHTFELVTGLPRTIVVTTSGRNVTQRLSDGINAAISRYNAENLGLTFVRGGSSGD